MRKLITLITFLIFVSACSQYEVFAPGSEENSQLESRSGIPSFSSLSSIDLGPTGAAEISAFDRCSRSIQPIHASPYGQYRSGTFWWPGQ